MAETAAHAFAGSAAEGLPTFSLSGGAPVLIVDIAVALGMAGSKGEARRLIAQGGVRLNDQVVTDAHAGVTGADLAKLEPVVKQANQLTRFVDSANVKDSLLVRVLVPGEPSPCL